MSRTRQAGPEGMRGSVIRRVGIGLALVILWGCGTVDPGTNGAARELDRAVFAAVIQPILDGRGCSEGQCHYRDQSDPNSGGPGGRFKIFDCEADPCSQEELDGNFDSASGMVNRSSPTASRLLEKPLAESAGGIQHLGGDVFLDASDPDYQSMLAWSQSSP
jgi:hypothetical protein